MGHYISLNESLYTYMIDVSLRDNDILRRLRAETESLQNAGWQIPPEHGAFTMLLLRAINARRTLEIGVFTGYSTLVAALALPEDGHIVACDINPDTTAIGRRYWQEAGVAHKVDLRLAPALDTLDALIRESAPPFDFAFIDADKGNTEIYYERCLQLVRPNGLITVDNAFMSGNVLNPANEAGSVMDAFLRKIHDDERVDLSLVPIGDGVLIARKR